MSIMIELLNCPRLTYTVVTASLRLSLYQAFDGGVKKCLMSPHLESAYFFFRQKPCVYKKDPNPLGLCHIFFVDQEYRLLSSEHIFYSVG